MSLSFLESTKDYSKYRVVIKYRFNLNKNLFSKKVIVMLITSKLFRILQQNLTLNYLDQTSKI